MAIIVKNTKGPATKKDNKKRFIIFFMVLFVLLMSSTVPVSSIPLVRSLVSAMGVPIDIQANLTLTQIVYGLFKGDLATRYGFDTTLAYHGDGGSYSGSDKRFGTMGIMGPIGFDDFTNIRGAELFNSRKTRDGMAIDGKDYPDMTNIKLREEDYGKTAPSIKSLELEGQSTLPKEFSLAGMGVGSGKDVDGAFTKPGATKDLEGFGTASGFSNSMRAFGGQMAFTAEDNKLNIARVNTSPLNWDNSTPKGKLGEIFLYERAAERSKYAEVKKELATAAFDGNEISDLMVYSDSKPSVSTQDWAADMEDFNKTDKVNKDAKECQNMANAARDMMAKFAAEAAALNKKRPECMDRCNRRHGNMSRREWNGKIDSLITQCKSHASQLNTNSMQCDQGKIKTGNCDGLGGQKVDECSAIQDIVGIGFICYDAYESDQNGYEPAVNDMLSRGDSGGRTEDTQSQDNSTTTQ